MVSTFNKQSPIDIKLWWSVPPKLKRCLVRSKLRDKPPSFLPRDLWINENKKSEPCHSKRCKTCSHITKETSFISSRSGLTYPIVTETNCNSSDLVYLIDCTNPACLQTRKPPQYVGETGQKLRERMNGHRSAVRHSEPTPVGQHFNLPGHSFDDAQVTVIEKTNGTEERHKREYHWISQLMTDAPLGLNEEHPLRGCKPFSRSNNNKPAPPTKVMVNATLDEQSFLTWDGQVIIRAMNEGMAKILRKFDSIIRPHNVTIAADVPGDGSCFFHCLTHSEYSRNLLNQVPRNRSFT